MNGVASLGSTFSYDMSTWTARYGRPTELFLAMHLSTMMPDLAYEMATNSNFNTKVNIVMQKVNLEYDTTVTAANGAKYTNDQIVNAFLDYGLRGEDKHYSYTEKRTRTVNGKKEEYEEEITGSVNYYQEILATLETQEDRNEFIRDIFQQIKDHYKLTTGYFGVNIENALIDANNDRPIGKFFKKLENDLKALVDKIFTGNSEYLVEIVRGDEEVPGLSGITYDDLFELADIVAQGLDGISGVKWPYIQSVTNHWFYQDIDFTKGVYRRTKTATKRISYVPADDDATTLNKHNIKVDLDATLSSEEGIVYQVCEPEAYGPNQEIINTFKDKYYKYDGTKQTADAIENAKMLDKNNEKTGIRYGDGKITETRTIDKQEVSFEENKVNALTAFSILENMHSEEGDFAYRNLKELMYTLNYFDEEDLTEELKEVLLWLIEVDVPDGINENFDITRDPDEYGIVIKNVAGRHILAPENCKITTEVDESGENVVTLKFSGLSDETVELLEYIHKDDFKNINKDSMAGITMKIKGMTLNSGIGTNVSRGTYIGNANGDLQVVMLDVDKSLIEDVEEYLKPSNNNAYYQAIYNTRNKIYGEGIDIGYYTGDGLERGSGAGNSAVSYGNGIWSYNDSDFDLICAITASEDRGSYDGALAVITTACNRTVSKQWKNRGADPLSQYRAAGQFEGYFGGHYKNLLNGNYPDYVRQAVEDALNDGKRNHNYCSFRGYYIERNEKQEQIGKNGNWYFNPIR